MHCAREGYAFYTKEIIIILNFSLILMLAAKALRLPQRLPTLKTFSFGKLNMIH